MNIYEKLQKIKVELLDCNLKKSGHNKFAGFDYYELADIMPDIIKLCDKYKVYTSICFHENNTVSLAAYDCEDLEAKVPMVITPTAMLEIRGANAVQSLGGMQTYLRRYLYLAMFDITENDVFDATSGKKYCCEDCGTEFKPFTDNKTNKWCGSNVAYKLTKEKYGRAICKDCREKSKNSEGSNGTLGGKTKSERQILANGSERFPNVAFAPKEKTKENTKTNITPLSTNVDISPREKTTSVSDPLFEEFWKAYPRKANKPSAVRAFGKIKPMSRATLAKIIAGVEKHKQSEQWQKDGGQFIPHPATFLNQQRWEDEIIYGGTQNGVNKRNNGQFKPIRQCVNEYPE